MTLQPLTYRIGAAAYTGYVADGSAERRVPGVAFALDLFGDPRPTLDQARQMVHSCVATYRRMTSAPIGARGSQCAANPRLCQVFRHP